MRICDAGKHASAGSSPTYLRPCLPSSLPNQIFFIFYKRHFILSLSISFFFFFTNQGRRTGCYLEGRGINVISASNKNACCRLCPKNIPPRESNFTDAFTWSLTFFCCCFYFGSRSIGTFEPGQMAGLRSDKSRALLHH